MNRQPPGMIPPRYPATGTIVRMVGTNRPTRSFVPEAPTFPPPNTPRARPLLFLGNQAEFQAIPAVNELPARPNSRVQASNSG